MINPDSPLDWYLLLRYSDVLYDYQLSFRN